MKLARSLALLSFATLAGCSDDVDLDASVQRYCEAVCGCAGVCDGSAFDCDGAIGNQVELAEERGCEEELAALLDCSAEQICSPGGTDCNSEGEQANDCLSSGGSKSPLD